MLTLLSFKTALQVVSPGLVWLFHGHWVARFHHYFCFTSLFLCFHAYFASWPKEAVGAPALSYVFQKGGWKEG